jgi:PAS domain S-box-containing protein
MIGFLKLATDDAKAAGYSALRVTGEMTWVLGGDPGTERVMEYEAKLNYFFPENDALALCQYNRNRFSPQVIKSVISTHPYVIYGGLVSSNFYYIPPDAFLEEEQPAREIDRLLANITSREKMGRELRRYQEHLEELVKERTVELKRINERFSLATNAARLGVWDWDLQKNELVWDDRMYSLYGIKREDFTGAYEAWLKRVHPDDRARFDEESKLARRGEREYDTEFRVVWPDGSTHYLKAYGQVVRDIDGQPLRMTGINFDVTEPKRVEALLNGQTRVMELVAKGAPLAESLTALVRLIEEHTPGMLGSILLLDEDGVHLRHGAAPSLPLEYTEAIDGVAIGPNVGSCGTAAYCGEVVIVEDIATSPLWEDYKAVALPHKLHACWSTPICDEQGRVLGTFAMYYRQPGLPKLEHLRLIDVTAHIAAIAIKRDRTQAALRESEELHRLTLSNLTDAVFVTDDAGYFKYISPNVDIIFGHSFGEVQAMGNISDLLGEDVFPASKFEALRELKNIEWDIIDKAGKVHSLLVNVKQVSIKGGTRLYICRDVTERKRADEEMRTSEGRYRMAQAIGHVGNWEYNLQTTEFWGSDEAKRIYGFDPAQAAFSTDEVEDCISERERVHQALLDLINEGKEYNLEFEIYPRDSSEPRIIASVAQLQRDEYGNPLTVVGVIQDITERKRMDQALRESEEKYKELVHNIQAAVVVHEADTRISICNPAAQELLGLTEDQMLGKAAVDPAWHFSREDGTIMPPEEYPVNQVITTGQPLRNFTLLAHRPDRGDNVWVLVNADPVFGSDGGISRVIVTFVDITERKLAEEHKREFYKRTILAATGGKLQMTDREEVERIAGPPIAVFPVRDPDDFRVIRKAVFDTANACGMEESRVGDLVVAVGEVVTNAIKHAGGGTASIHGLPDSVLAVISDEGPGIEAMTIPDVAFARGYTTAGTLGMGYKIVISMADKVYLATGPGGTTVGIEMMLQKVKSTLDLQEFARY